MANEIGVGTNFFTPVNSNIDVALTNSAGNAALVRCAVANIPTGAGYAVGCLLQATDTGGIYTNTGTTASASFTLLEDAGGSFTLPTSATDASTTSGNSFALTQSALTSGNGLLQTLAAMTTGIGHKVVATAATLTGAGRYFSANDGSLEVFGVGPNGHLHNSQTTAPTVAIHTNGGISAAAVVAGSSDTCGSFTTTGTQSTSADSLLQFSFNKSYTSAPKSVVLTPANNSAAGGASSVGLGYVSSVGATGFVVGVAKIPVSSTAGATPSWYYQVIA